MYDIVLDVGSFGSIVLLFLPKKAFYSHLRMRGRERGQGDKVLRRGKGRARSRGGDGTRYQATKQRGARMLRPILLNMETKGTFYHQAG